MGVENCLLDLRIACSKQAEDYEAKIKQYEGLIQTKNDDMRRLTAAHNKSIGDRDYWKSIAIGCGFYIVTNLVISIVWLIAR